MVRRIHVVVLTFLIVSLCNAQHRTGELQITVVDQSGAALKASGTATSQATQTHVSFVTDEAGSASLRNLPFGTYRITVERPGFVPAAIMTDIQSVLAIRLNVTLRVAAAGTEVVIQDVSTLVDPHQTASVYYVGSQAIEERRLSGPGRGLLDMVNAQPGWLMEANGVLHPRGSEYDTQFVTDGLPVTDNRSPAFAPELDADDVQSIHVLTANYPAEYGRKLGGIVEVQTDRDPRSGVHGRWTAGGGSFGTAGASAAIQFGVGRNSFAVSGDASRTDRYLDPPVEENFTNSGTTRSGGARAEHDFVNGDRIRAIVDWRAAGFNVPNEMVQEEAGQRQDRGNRETAGALTYQHVFSPSLIGDIRGRVRDVSAELWSNAQSTPIQPFQQRGFREGYINASVAGRAGRHEWKAGGDGLFASVHEAFAFHMTDEDAFDNDTPHDFAFSDRQQDREQAAFVQDTIQLGRLTVSAGLRFDHYSFVVADHAFSPRIGAAWYIPSAGLILRGSYDRAFQTPAIENLLLASSPQLQALNENVLRLPVPPSRGDFYQAGFVKTFFDRVRLESNWFRRDISQFSDDDLLLNTGVSFPIAFAHADIHGIETKIEVPRWGRFSGFISYANMTGTGRFPITGGLFLEAGAADLLRSTQSFPITQDQRNTARGRVRYQVSSRVWAAVNAQYGSGLPVELENDANTAASPRVLERVNFERGRVRPSFIVDASVGARLWGREGKSLHVQADVANITDQLNLINFAGVFSGTAIGPPRSAGVRIRMEF